MAARAARRRRVRAGRRRRIQPASRLRGARSARQLDGSAGRARRSPRDRLAAHDYLAVEHVATGRQRAGKRKLREVTPEFLAVARLQEDLLAVDEREAAKAVELDLVDVLLALGSALRESASCGLIGGFSGSVMPRPPRRARVLRPLRSASGLRARLGCTRFGSPFCLAKCGGHGASPSPSRSSRAASSSSELQASRVLVDLSRRIAALLQPRRHRLERQLDRARRRRPRPTRADTTRARQAPRARSTPRRSCGRARSGCSR